MTPERWRQIEDLYHRALKLQKSQRAKVVLRFTKQRESTLPVHIGTQTVSREIIGWLGKSVMSIVVHSLLLIAGLLCYPTLARAQNEDFTGVELSYGLGFSRLWDGEGFLGNGPGVSAGAAYFVRPNLSLGLDLNRSNHSGVLPMEGGVNRRSDGKTTFVSFNTWYYFTAIEFDGRRLTPFITGGVGAGLASRTNFIERTVLSHGAFLGRAQYDQVVISREKIGENEVALNGGAGVDLALWWRVSVRPEVRFFGGPSQTAIRGLVTLVIR